MMSQSLRARTERAMIFPLAIVILGVLILAGAFSYVTISAQRDQHMRQSALLVQLLSRHEAAERDHLGRAASLPRSSVQEDLGVSMEYRVWSDVGPVTESRGMPTMERMLQPGFHTRITEGTRWRVFVLRQTTPDMSVEIAEPMSLRVNEAVVVVFSLALPLILLILAVAVIGRRGIAQALAPLSSLSRQIDQRDADDLTLIDTEALDYEIKPMALALNSLFGRLDEAFVRERAFSDNAAHELRTPLATLKLRSQVIAAKLKNDPAFQKDAAQFQEAIDRAGQVIEHLLCLARLEHQERGELMFDFATCVKQAIAEVAPVAAAKAIEISAEMPNDAEMRGDELAATMAIRNLLENAVKFTPENGTVDIFLNADAHNIELRVRDSGPGLKAGEEQRVFERFYRGSSAIPGSGLGLALVSAVAQLHGGSVKASNIEPHGSEFMLSLARN